MNPYLLDDYTTTPFQTIRSLFISEYALRHWEAAKETGWLGHRVIACFESVPLIGQLLSVIEYIFAKAVTEDPWAKRARLSDLSVIVPPSSPVAEDSPGIADLIKLSTSTSFEADIARAESDPLVHDFLVDVETSLNTRTLRKDCWFECSFLTPYISTIVLKKDLPYNREFLQHLLRGFLFKHSHKSFLMGIIQEGDVIWTYRKGVSEEPRERFHTPRPYTNFIFVYQARTCMTAVRPKSRGSRLTLND